MGNGAPGWAGRTPGTGPSSEGTVRGWYRAGGGLSKPAGRKHWLEKCSWIEDTQVRSCLKHRIQDHLLLIKDRYAALFPIPVAKFVVLVVYNPGG